MEKIVNGHKVKINNIVLFERAAEGMIVNSKTINFNTNGITAKVDTSLVNTILKLYNISYKAMPYPLYAIEDDVKYAVIGNFIKRVASNDMFMWVNEGLNIELNGLGDTLKIVNNTWSIYNHKGNMQGNLSLDNYVNNIGYKEYRWFLDRLINKEDTFEYYRIFMPDFVIACNSDRNIMRHELENMLIFENIPRKFNLDSNKIIDITRNEEYILDIFKTGKVKTSEKSTLWDLTSCGKIDSNNREINTYGYDAYVKQSKDREYASEKLKKSNKPGILSVFLKLCSIKESCDYIKFPEYRSIIINNKIILLVQGIMYITDLDRLSSMKSIAGEVDLYSIRNNDIYFIKKKQIANKIYKEVVYAYNILKDEVRVCSLQFK